MSLTTVLSILILVPLISGLLLLRYRDTIQPRIKLFLSFSASFLLAISLTHLLPELFVNGHELGLYVLIGFFIQIVLEYFSAGIEHGHMHHVSTRKFPVLLFLSLFIHSLIEGFPIAETMLNQDDSGTSKAILSGIILHKIPIAIVLTGLLLDKGLKTSSIVLSLILFSLSAPLGLISVYFGTSQDIAGLSGPLTAIAVGIILHVSTVILFESSENHRFNIGKFISILLGTLLALFLFGVH